MLAVGRPFARRRLPAGTAAGTCGRRRAAARLDPRAAARRAAARLGPRATARRAAGEIPLRPCAAALHLRAADDLLGAVLVAHPCLLPAVVIGGEQDQPGRTAERGAGLVALGVQPPPDAHERVVLELLGHGGGLAVAGVDAGGRR